MSRKDAIGLFWQDEVKVRKPATVKVKRQPPERHWERPDYLPNLDVARQLKLDLFTDYELGVAAANGETLIFDIECYPNYVLFAFRSVESRKCIYFELSDLWLGTEALELNKLLWVLQNFRLITFNGRKYDLPISSIAMTGANAEMLWEATDLMIGQQIQAKDVMKRFKASRLKEINQIDLIELTAQAPGLKVCAGRLHAKRLQELPIKPGTYLSEDQATIVRWYCFNDLDNTELLFESLSEQIRYREEIGEQYKLDLRSHSDAQMAESIIASEIKKITGQKHIQRTEIQPGTPYRYKPPAYLKFHSKILQTVFDMVCNETYIVDQNGNIQAPAYFDDFAFTINKSTYKVGIGGLHSQEKSISHKTDDEYEVIDTDVTSYYPYLILNAGIFPASLGQNFLKVFRNIVETRVKAKSDGNTVLAEVLKIVVNGTFGKLGSMWSIMYAPDLLLRVTLTGQLSILMLVEMCELSGIEVTSVNTDGMVVRCHRSKREQFNQIVKYWEHVSGLNTEETRYKATFSKDINNYIAIYDKPQKGKHFKTKGVYAATSSKKNAVNEICHEAVAQYLLDGTLIDKYIRECKDIRKFTTMKACNKGGGAVKVHESEYNPKLTTQEKAAFVISRGAFEQDGKWFPPNYNVEQFAGATLEAVYKGVCAPTKVEYLGEIVRWYYATGVQGELVLAKTGNKVSRSDGAKPCMVLPDEFPDDINYDWYVQEAYKVLENIGAVTS